MAGVNYRSTFIAVADDCPASTGAEPPLRSKPTTARLQYEMLMSAPYRHTSEDVIFAASTAGRSVAGAPPDDHRAAQDEYFAEPRACLRASPLPKQYGWGIHCDDAGLVALVSSGSERYERLLGDASIKQLKAMRRSRA
jgi:hypothetical protein